MLELADIFRACGQAYQEKHAGHLLGSHRRALRDIARCRTPALGGEVYFCSDCDDYRYSYHSCQNRHCPKCGNDKATTWLAAQQALLLPVTHFLVTITLPSELRRLAYQHQKLIYGMLMRCGAQAMQKLAKDPRFIGGNIAILAMLQTWRRDMLFHPHAHFIVPGGGLSRDGQKWLPAQRRYLMPHRALAKIFRAKFRHALKKTELITQVPEHVWRSKWVIDIRAVGKGKTALKYLAPYLFRVAISNKRLVSFEAGRVTFRYKPSDTGKWQTQTLPVEAFIQRFLLHVLPKRFVKLRYYGFWNPRQRQQLDYLKELFHAAEALPASSTTEDLGETHRELRCPKCGGPLVFVRILLPQKCRSP